MTDWTSLFNAEAAVSPSRELSVRVVSRHGRPLLLLPDARLLAARGLTLYAAQTLPARFAKGVLGLALRLGVPIPLRKARLPVNAASPFSRFCSQWFPPERAAILLGNPAAPGQRFIILGFDDRGEPAAIVKAGVTEAARELIRQETCFLKAAYGTPGIPVLRGVLGGAPVSAFAIDYAEGEPPRDFPGLPELLGSWLKPEETVSFGETKAGQALGERVSVGMRGAIFHPALHHGDFAPWNIRIGKRCTVIDWERGDLLGVPAWDWFHFVIQPAVLVGKEPAEQMLRRIEALWASPAFREYAVRAGIRGLEKKLLAAYLLHCTEVIRQTEGCDTLRKLQELLGAK